MEFDNKCVLIADNGLFVCLAETLAKSFGKVYYHSPWVGAFPKSNQKLLGKGLPNVERIEDIWDVKDEVDLWVFPDIYTSGLQLELESQGKRVWGSRKGDELELYRKESKNHMKKLGLPIKPFEVVKGTGALREYLKKHEKQYVKISTTRGDMETFYSKNYKLVEPRIDELEYLLGAKKKIMEFVCEDAIEDAVEVGYDGFCVDGVFPEHAMCGVEIKDIGYVGKFEAYKDMPKQIQTINDKLSPTLKEYGYKNFFCCEFRITRDGTPWIIDPMTRFGSPPGELIQNMYTNLAEILWEGADGKCVDPIPEAKFGAELLIHSGWADKNWQPIEFPKEIENNVKLRNHTIIDGRHYVVPQAVGLPEIGAVVATGDTMKEAIDKVKEMAEQIEGYFLDTYPDSLEKAVEEIEKLKEFGVTL